MLTSSCIFEIFSGVQVGPRHSFLEPPGGRKSKPYIENREDHVTSLYNKGVPYKFWCQSDV